MSNLVRTQVLLPRPLLEDLRQIAAERGESVSQLVRTQLDRAISKLLPKKISGPEALLKAAEWAEKHGITGPSDLSTNDEYLYGKLAPDYRGEK